MLSDFCKIRMYVDQFNHCASVRSGSVGLKNNERKLEIKEKHFVLYR